MVARVRVRYNIDMISSLFDQELAAKFPSPMGVGPNSGQHIFDVFESNGDSSFASLPGYKRHFVYKC
jgi:hypothetical protein